MKYQLKMLLLLSCILFIPELWAQQKEKAIKAVSPDGNIAIVMSTASQILISVEYKGNVIMAPSPQAMDIREFPDAYKNPEVRVITRTPHNDTIIPVVAEKRNIIPDVYNETEVWFKGKYGIRLRAYNDGVAWRFITRFPDSITVNSELVSLQMAKTDSVYFGEEDSFLSHSERFYPCKAASSIKENQMCVLPAVFRKANGNLAAFTESDLLDYPGLYLIGKGMRTATFAGTQPQYPSEKYISKDNRSYLVSKRENYIAKTIGTREFPWRVFGIATNDAQLVENDIVYRLASPCKLNETSWIKPGKVAWDWWNDWNIYNVPFKAGINTQTYKYYIDFASKFGLEYVIFDEGWSANDDLEKINPDMDMDALFDFARQKNVKIILWVTGRALQDKFETSLDRFQKWGCAGIKMDFMMRDDQEMVNFYEKVASETAKRHMLADFHGSYKPTGLSRTYPNQLTREGVRGLENSKWSTDITPTHDCTLPFTRMFAGPMDYTPGAMTNSTQGNFQARNSEPMSQGTRCHELAKYIAFESPLQMLCDAPTNYLKEPECLDFLSKVPTTWDETHGLDACIAHYLTLVRRNGNNWFLGSITDWTERDFEIKLSFLGDGNYTMESWSDGPNATRKAEDFLMNKATVDKNSTIKIHLAPGGGFVARFTTQNI
jgi:alpha-glucosidase